MLGAQLTPDNVQYFIVVEKILRKCTKQIHFCQCHGSMLKTESHASAFFHSRAVKCGSCQLTCISTILVQVCTCSHVRACHICRLFDCITTVSGEELWGVWFCSFGNFFTLTFFVLFCFLFLWWEKSVFWFCISLRFPYRTIHFQK